MHFHSRAQALLTDIETYGLKFTPTLNVDLIADKPDNRLLEPAETSGVDYLVTGNTNDFTMAYYKETKIVSPKEFFEVLKQ